MRNRKVASSKCSFNSKPAEVHLLCAAIGGEQAEELEVPPRSLFRRPLTPRRSQHCARHRANLELYERELMRERAVRERAVAR